MNNDLIISQTIETRLKNISARIDRLRYPHFADQTKPAAWIRNVIGPGGLANTFYYVSQNPSTSPFVVPLVLNGSVLYSTGSLRITNDAAYSASITVQLRYHQLLPSLYSEDEVAAGTDYIVLSEDERFFSNPSASPTLVEDFSLIAFFGEYFPEIVGTYGYLTIQIKTSTAVPSSQLYGISLFSELLIGA